MRYCYGLLHRQLGRHLKVLSPIASGIAKSYRPKGFPQWGGL
jgi:hypothetical protein